MPLDHDDRCAFQDRELILLKEQFRVLDTALSIISKQIAEFAEKRADDRIMWARMEKDVDHIRDKVDVIEETLKTEVATKQSVETMRKWWSLIAGAVIMAVASALVTWILRGGLKP